MSEAIPLDPETQSLIDAEVRSGGFLDAADVLRAAMRAFVDDSELAAADVRRLCDEGEASGIAGTADEVFARVQARLSARS